MPNRIISLLSCNQIDFTQTQTPDTLIETCMHGLLHRHQKNGNHLTTQDQQHIRDWLGN